MAPRVKVEDGLGPSSSELEASVLDVVGRRGQVTSNEILQALPAGTDNKQILGVYNSLLRQAKIQLKRRAADGALLYALAEPKVSKLAGLNINETALYKLIEGARNQGIWSRDLRNQLNLPKLQLEKGLRALETRKLVKTVKSANQKSKKIYMLYDLTPALELTGGPWFNEHHEYDVEFIRIIYQQVLAFIKERPYLSRDEICLKLNSSGVFKERLSIENVEQLLGTMVYDGSVVEFMDPGGTDEKPQTTYYQPKTIPVYNNLTEVPCGVCPVISSCAPGGMISPETCKYMDQWFEAIDW